MRILISPRSFRNNSISAIDQSASSFILPILFALIVAIFMAVAISAVGWFMAECLGNSFLDSNGIGTNHAKSAGRVGVGH